MHIHTIVSSPVTSYHTKPHNVNEQKSAFQIKKTDEHVTQEHSSTIYKTLADQYDIQNATFEELVHLSHTLYNAGEISLKEHMTLTFDYEKATNHLKRHAPGAIPSHFTMYETAANEYGQRNWIAEFEARASKDLSFGHTIGYHNKLKVLDILQRLAR